MTNLPAYPVGRHRPAPLRLPDDPTEATALALAVIKGDDTFDRAAAVEALTARAAKLTEADSAKALGQLATHLPILEALFLRFSLEANSTSLPENKSKLLRMALAAQASYARTQALVAGLRLQQQGKAHVNIEDLGDDL